MRPVLLAAALLSLGLGVRAARAQEAEITVETTREEPERNWGNLRVGASSASSRPELCLELSPIELLSVEACGTGAGLLHRDPDPEIAHFRAKWLVTSWQTPLGWLQPQLGAGFAELQIDADSVGFDFGGSGPTGVETAGPELSAALRLLTPIAQGFDLVSTLDLSTAWFPHASELVIPQAEVQPSATFTLGLGF